MADGYGLDYIMQYSAKGEYIRHFGGKGEEPHHLNNAHGVCIDQRDPNNPILLVTSRSTQDSSDLTLRAITGYHQTARCLDLPASH